MATTIKLEDFTLEELEKLEQLTGMTFGEISEDFNRPKVLKAVVWLSQLRTDPKARIEDVAKLTLADVTAIFTGDEDPKAE
jgi:NAD-dependent DNA ligase